MTTQTSLVLEVLSIVMKHAARLPQDRAGPMLEDVAEAIDYAIKREEKVLGLKRLANKQHFSQN